MSTPSSMKAIYYALGANLGIAIAKSSAALWTGSGAMLAEAIHSFADSGNQLLLLLGMQRSKRGADELHPLGYGRAMYFWALIVAVLLFTMGGLFSVVEGVERLLHPEPMRSPLLAVFILLLSVGLEGASLAAALKEIQHERGPHSLWQWFRITRKSELMVVAGEDVAALTGLALALVAVLLAWISGNPLFDAAGSISVGVLLMVVAVLVGREIKSLIIGESAAPEVHKGIHTFLDGREEIHRVLNLITLQWGEELVVAVKVAMAREDIEGREMIIQINRCEAALKAAYPDIKWLFFEPDFAD